MSGEGASLSAKPKAKSSRFAAGKKAERDDVAAYLERRERNATTIAENKAAAPETREFARDRARQLQVVIHEIRSGLHEGDDALARDQAGRGLKT